ncbi:MAG: hypothetical protein AAFR03_00410 [Pseudomonadota bacterium]
MKPGRKDIQQGRDASDPLTGPWLDYAHVPPVRYAFDQARTSHARSTTSRSQSEGKDRPTPALKPRNAGWLETEYAHVMAKAKARDMIEGRLQNHDRRSDHPRGPGRGQ